jgi:curved DNA-binding protein CbpA
MAYGRAWRREVMVMAAAEQGDPVPDLYQLLGISRGASGGEIARAWRRRALAEHPDRRPRDAAAPARFRVLLEAYEVLGDPARRAAYDRSRGDQPGPGAAAPEAPAAGVPTGRPCGSGVSVVVRRAGRAPEPPLRAGPVWAEVPGTAPAAGSRTAEDDVVRLAALAELAVRYLAGHRGWPW